jgi:hypothetical protein
VKPHVVIEAVFDQVFVFVFIRADVYRVSRRFRINRGVVQNHFDASCSAATLRSAFDSKFNHDRTDGTDTDGNKPPIGREDHHHGVDDDAPRASVAGISIAIIETRVVVGQDEGG